MEWIKFVETTVAFAIPFADALFDLPIYFEGWKAINRTVSSIFAAGFYMYIRFKDPNLIFIDLEAWWWFFIAAFVLLLVYIFIYTKKKTAILGLIVFVLFYTSLTAGFSLLFQSLNYTKIVCNVIDEESKKSIQDVTIMLRFVDKESGVTDDYIIGEKTNANGSLCRYVDNQKLEKLMFYGASQDDYIDKLKISIDKSRLKDLKSITLKHQ